MLFLHLLRYHVVFDFSLVNVVYDVDCFAYVEASLCTQDESHLVMMYDLFYMLDSDSQNFVENFCVYIHERYWPIVFFFGGIFVWFWN